MGNQVAILLRDGPYQKWQFICYSVSPDEGWTFASVIQQQERFLFGHKRARAIVAERDAYDTGRVKEIPPPAGWDSGLMSDKEYEASIRSENASDDPGMRPQGTETA